MIKYRLHFIVFCCVPKVESADEDCQSNKRQKTLHDVLNEGRNNSSYHPTMGHVVAICHARIPFIQIREEVLIEIRNDLRRSDSMPSFTKPVFQR